MHIQIKIILLWHNVFEALTGGKDIIDELLVADSSILVPVDAAEHIQDPWLQVTDPLYVTLSPNIEVKVCKFFHLWKRISHHWSSHTKVLDCRAQFLTFLWVLLAHLKKHIDLFECLLVLLQVFPSGHRQQPEFLPLNDQLTELWGVGFKVLQGDGRSRLQLQSAPPLWMETHQHSNLEWA